MDSLVLKINTISALLTILTEIAIVIGIFLLFKKGKTDAFTQFLSRHALLFSFLIALGASLGSFFYSNVAGFKPCVLCWWQRIFLFPQVILLGIAVWKKDGRALLYALPLSIVGGIIALYNTYIQYGGNELIPCSTDTESVSCAIRYVFEFGFITIPLMSLSTFGALIVLALLYRKGTQ